MSVADSAFEWKIAYRNMFRNKWRTLATMSAIVTGFCGITLLGGYINRVENYLRVSTIYINHVGHIAIYKKQAVDFFYLSPKKYLLKNEDVQKILDILNAGPFNNEVEFTGKYLTGMGLISNGGNSHPFIAKGIEPLVAYKVNNHPLVIKWTKELSLSDQGVDFQSAFEKNNTSISITKEMGELLNLKAPFLQLSQEQREVQLAGKTVYGDLNAINAIVNLQHTTGYKLAEDTGLLAPLSVLQNLYLLDGISHFAIYLNAQARPLGTVISDLSSKLKNVGLDLDIIPFNDERVGQFYVGSMSFLYIMAFFFVFIICSAVVISIVNAMTMGILERSREIGTMRSLGISSQVVSRIFTKEAVLVTLFGAVVGVVMSFMIGFIVNILNIRFYPPGIAGSMQFVITPTFSLFGATFLFMLVLALVTGVIVANKKSKNKIIQLLTDTGKS